tara:strand:+ start:141 stop:500 length:360 start_codon:yes stop_codon:yes gene_type:complete
MPSNPLSRLTRGLGHDKGSKIKGVASPPTRSEGKDGDMQIYNGHLYIKDKYTWHHFVPKSEFRINQLIDKTGGTAVETIPNTTSTTLGISPTTISFDKAIASLAAKLNKIIELLQLDIK